MMRKRHVGCFLSPRPGLDPFGMHTHGFTVGYFLSRHPALKQNAVWLKSAGEKLFAAAAVRDGLAVEVGEDDLVGEEGDPFEGVRAVGGGAANEFVLAVAMFDEPGGAELLDNLAGDACRCEMIQFHALRLWEGVGQWLSNQNLFREYVDGANSGFCAGEYPANVYAVRENNSMNIPIDSSPVPVDGRRGPRMEWLKILTGRKYLTGQLKQIKNSTYRIVAAQCGM